MLIAIPFEVSFESQFPPLAAETLASRQFKCAARFDNDINSDHSRHKFVGEKSSNTLTFFDACGWLLRLLLFYRFAARFWHNSGT